MNSKQIFLVDGTNILKEAFVKQLQKEGYKNEGFTKYNGYYVSPNSFINNQYTFLSVEMAWGGYTKYTLPEQWNEALQAFRDYFKEDEIKVGDWVVALNAAAGQYTIGSIYKVKGISIFNIDTEFDDSGSTRNAWDIFRFRKATEEEVCNYLAEKAGLKVGMKGIFHGRKFYNCYYEIYGNTFL